MSSNTQVVRGAEKWSRGTKWSRRRSQVEPFRPADPPRFRGCRQTGRTTGRPTTPADRSRPRQVDLLSAAPAASLHAPNHPAKMRCRCGRTGQPRRRNSQALRRTASPPSAPGSDGHRNPDILACPRAQRRTPRHRAAHRRVPRHRRGRVDQPPLRVPQPDLLLLHQRAGHRHGPRRGRRRLDRHRPGRGRRRRPPGPALPAPQGPSTRTAAASSSRSAPPSPCSTSCPPGAPRPEATCNYSYLIADVLVANSLGAPLIAAAITATQGYPGRTLEVHPRPGPPRRAGRGHRRPRRPPAHEDDTNVGLAADRAPADRPRAALPAVRTRHPRGQQRRARLRLRRPGLEQVSPDEAGTRADRRRRAGPAQRRAGGAVAAAVPGRGADAWSSPPRTARSGTTARATRTTSSVAARWPPPRRPVLDLPARGPPRRQAAGLARRGLSPSCWARRSTTAAGEPGYLEVLRPPQRHRAPSPTATGPRWTPCSPTSTRRSGTSSCSPRSATTPTTTG